MCRFIEHERCQSDVFIKERNDGEMMDVKDQLTPIAKEVSSQSIVLTHF